MADPRFFDNRGPFTLAEVCARANASMPADADGSLAIEDIASLSGAGPQHLTFFTGAASNAEEFAASKAGFCLTPQSLGKRVPPSSMVVVPCASVTHAFAATARLFYPDSCLASWSQQTSVDPSATIGENVQIAPGVVIGAKAQIGDGTKLGPNVVIGRGVAIGKNCEIGSNATITHSYLGDEVLVLPGAQIGGPGFGFASGPSGHIKIPQIGRVIIQDKVEIGACTTVDRGALGDTVIGEGTKIDNLVQIGHGTRLGRHCVIVGQVGISGSCEIGDFVVMGGQVGIADHAKIGTGARIAARSAMASGAELAGGADYGGTPARPVREWIREMHTLSAMAKRERK
ncbi:MAG TPA: UDP-3-O-(3-hydroxymyristoyl)glucosamine N-acyltransferase [Rhizomicrobium sp.]|jgi:UDP-3-O-[3-hydroxymyristoyl] glucosamine N-acyltransferase|nr:UDP-3-O-(3-hydroxymyristoyl)glucosamine N-acyltransferase [Rhizomicrobium sp.]